MSEKITRRDFMTGAAAMGALFAAGSLAACGQSASSTDTATATAAESTSSTTEAASTDWLGEAPKIADSDIATTKDADVVVVGAGTGGLFAACAAAESGATVVVLEKGETYGNVKDDLGAVNSKLQIEDGTVIDRQAMALDMYRYSNAHLSLPLFYKWYDNSAECIDWYTDLLAKSSVVMWHEAAIGDKEGLVAHWATGHSPAWPVDADGKPTLDGGKVLGDYATANGAEILFSTPMIELLMEGSKVAGVIAQDKDGKYVKVTAKKGVIIATGGYGSNADMLHALQPDVEKIRAQTWAPATNAGDGIKACLWAGASMDKVHSSMFFDRAAIMPNEFSGVATKGAMFWMGTQPWLKVNLNGERFTNEGTGVYDWILHAAMNQPNNTYCSVFDSNWKTYAEQFVMHGCSRLFAFENGAPSNHDIAYAEGALGKLVDGGQVIKADTLEDLAKGLGLPVDTFVATVKRYNELADKGVDEDFGKESYRLSKLDTAPFYGVRQSGCLLCTMDGIRIDSNCQAIAEDGTPIEGLYVTGNDSGCYYDTSYPNQSTGNACGRTVTFGRCIGKMLAGK